MSLGAKRQAVIRRHQEQQREQKGYLRQALELVRVEKSDDISAEEIVSELKSEDINIRIVDRACFLIWARECPADR